MNKGFIADLFYIVFLLCFIYYCILTLYYLFLAFVALFETRKRIHQHKLEDYENISSSAFTLPVSVIIPAHNEEDWILDSVKAVLNLRYPEFEVIVVNDGSTDNTQQILQKELGLVAITKPYVATFDAGEIHGIFQSTIYPQVTVVAKASGFKKAGALNVGIEFAKYKYVCILDADTILEPDALLKTMAHVQKDPDHIIGIGSYFGLVNGFKIENGTIIERSFSHNPLVANQNLEYIRSFIVNRIAWSKYNASPILAGGFSIWRRDILLDLGGYSSHFSSEDLEFTFRAQDYIIENKKKDYKIIMLPYFVGWTEGPSDVFSLLMQRNRWQRVINETTWKYKHVIFSPSHKMFAFFTAPYFLFYEVLGVFIEAISIAFVIFGVVTKILDIRILLSFLLLMILTQSIFSLISLFVFARDQKAYRMKDIFYFAVLSLLEFFWYHWLLLFAKITGTIDYFQGVKVFDKYQRSKRA